MTRKSLFIWVFLIFSNPFVCSASDTFAAEPQAFLPLNIYEFSPVVEGTAVAHEFILNNRGNVPLQILKLDSG